MLKTRVFINGSRENEASKRQVRPSCDCRNFSSRMRQGGAGRSPRDPSRKSLILQVGKLTPVL